MLNVAKLTAAFLLAAAILVGGSLVAYKAYLTSQIGQPNPAAAANPGPEPECVSPGVIVPTSNVEAK